MASTPERIRIHYRRPPDREDVYVQRLIRRTAEGVVTFLPRTPLARPLIEQGRVRLEPDAPIVWFTFAGARHDIGRFHRADGTFTGIYANIITPVEGLDGSTWHTTDLFLDVWLPAGGSPMLLDANELDAAERSGAVDAPTAYQARAEADRLMAAALAGSWPPRLVHDWPIERVLDTLGGT